MPPKPIELYTSESFLSSDNHDGKIQMSSYPDAVNFLLKRNSDEHQKLLDNIYNVYLTVICLISLCISMVLLFVVLFLCNRVEALRRYWIVSNNRFNENFYDEVF
ncbi:uncharacterized protein LOC143452506 [Clavelina lepadiformis]|uniref:uncharacterized protein LOC143452506 n=1 Tax=Clavelina lepadiformis TaxID=159417 RepID=UPI00404110DC